VSLKKYSIKNDSVLSILEDFRYTYRELYQPEKTNNCLFPEMKGMGDHYTGEDEMWRIIDMGEEHDGAASTSVCYAIKPDHYKGTHPEEYSKTWNGLNASLTEELGVQHSALSTLYPPQGFIGWHNNANASAYNIIFTWSEHGDGWFKYVDPKTQEVITIQDDKGWNLKAGHFGTYGSGDVVYHSAKTDCYRMTLSYTLGHDEDYWKDCVDFITNP
jgi:hypothetical protein